MSVTRRDKVARNLKLKESKSRNAWFFFFCNRLRTIHIWNLNKYFYVKDRRGHSKMQLIDSTYP